MEAPVPASQEGDGLRILRSRASRCPMGLGHTQCDLADDWGSWKASADSPGPSSTGIGHGRFNSLTGPKCELCGEGYKRCDASPGRLCASCHRRHYGPDTPCLYGKACQLCGFALRPDAIRLDYCSRCPHRAAVATQAGA